MRDRRSDRGRPDPEARELGPTVAGGLLGLLAGVAIDIAWLGWSGWGVLAGAILGTTAGALLGRSFGRDRGDPGSGPRRPGDGRRGPRTG